MRNIIITNNKLSADFFADALDVVFVEGGYKDVLTAVRDHVHRGFKLLTHPLSGSVKPNENPYKSVILSRVAAAGGMDLDSLYTIENCIVTADKFPQKYLQPLPEQIDTDFRMIDFSLIRSYL